MQKPTLEAIREAASGERSVKVDFRGVIIDCRYRNEAVTLDALATIDRMATLASDAEGFEALCDRAAALLIGWDVTDDGQPVAVVDGLRSMPLEFLSKIVLAVTIDAAFPASASSASLGNSEFALHDGGEKFRSRQALRPLLQRLGGVRQRGRR